MTNIKRIERFTKLMLAELRSNVHKGPPGSWESIDPKLLLVDLLYHAAKLAAAMKENNLADAKEYSADIANMAMMVLESFECKIHKDSSLLDIY